MISIRKTAQGAVFEVLVQPRSSKNMIAGIHGQALKIKLTAPPVDNAANRMCLTYLAGCLGISRASLEIVAGHTSRTKKVLWRLSDAKSTPKTLRKLKDRLASLSAS